LNMEVLSGELVARSLKQEGVDCVFGLCGGHVIPILEGLKKYGIRYVGTYHETAAVHMADAYARNTGRIGVALVTAGPGVANAFTGAIVAQRSGAPLLLLAGRSADEKKDLEDAQEMDQEAAMAPITKWARTCHSSARIPEYVAAAVREATSGRPGVAFLDFPLDIINSKIEEDNVPSAKGRRSMARPAGEMRYIKEAVDKLKMAKHPVIYAGSGVNWSRAGNELESFCKTTGIPVITWEMARGIIPDDRECVTSTGVLPMADVVMVLGARLDWMLGFGRPPFIQDEATLIQVDTEPTEIGQNRRADVGIVGDIKLVLQQMMDLIKEDVSSFNIEESWPPKIMDPKLKAAVDMVGKNPSGDINIVDLCVVLRSKLDHDTILILDGGETGLFAMQLIPMLSHSPSFMSGSFGQIGVGLPAAIGTKLANPNKRVVLLTGDGSFGFHAMEMGTSLVNDAKIDVIIANDASWGMIKVDYKRWYGYTGNGTCVNDVRYDKMFEAIGCHGEYVEKYDQLAEAIQRAFDSDTSSLVNVKIDNALSLQRTERAKFA
jgi:thiamine pyrophosphate-dependent acetolactate synthase large subunit-like protein